MGQITHHLPENYLVAYAAGSLPHAFSVVEAAHISMCDQCRASLLAHEQVGGRMLGDLAPQSLSEGLRNTILDKLDTAEPELPQSAPTRQGIYPGPVAELLQDGTPTWQKMGLGAAQSILYEGETESLRLLYIPPGKKMPAHSHHGEEMTLVLQGSFSDETGYFGVGDCEIGDDELEHSPIAGPEEPCICLAATNAPLKFKSFLPRLFQSRFRI